MAEAKQPHLDGAFYVPSIPPPSKTYHRPGRGSSCNPFSCCCGCLFNCLCTCIFQIICTILVIVGVIVLILWLIFRPNPVKFYATNASLTEFNFSPANNNTLYYNLALNMTIRNPNKRIGIYYDNIEVRALYQGERFATTNVQPFYQGHKNTTTLDNIVFRGQNLVLLGNDDVSKYNEDRSSGTYYIDVKLYLRIRFKVGLVKTPKFKPKIECDLKVPLHANGTSSGTFESTRCDLDW